MYRIGIPGAVGAALIFLSHPVFLGGHTNDLAKSFRKIIGIIKAHIHGNTLYRMIGEVQLLCSLLHLQLDEIVNGCVAGLLFKET